MERVLAAGADVLAEHGYEGFTLAQVALAANVSNGTIYWRVDNKEALFAAIQEREIDRLTAEIEILDDESQWLGQSLGEQLHGALEVVAESFRRRLGLMQTFIARSMVDVPTFDRGGSAATRTGTLIERRLLSCREEIRHPDPEQAVQRVVQTLFASLVQHVATSRSHHLVRDEDWSRLIDDLTVIGLAYLLHGDAEAAW